MRLLDCAGAARMCARPLIGHGLYARSAAPYEENDREHQADDEQDPSDIGSRAGDARKAEHARNERYHEKYQRVIDHGSTLLLPNLPTAGCKLCATGEALRVAYVLHLLARLRP